MVYVTSETTTADGAPVTIDHPHQPAFDAVYEVIRQLGDALPASPVERNVMIWHAVSVALDAGPQPAKPVDTAGVPHDVLVRAQRAALAALSAEPKVRPPLFSIRTRISDAAATVGWRAAKDTLTWLQGSGEQP